MIGVAALSPMSQVTSPKESKKALVDSDRNSDTFSNRTLGSRKRSRTTLDKKNDAVPIKLSMHQQKAQRLMAEREEKKFWNKQNEVDRFATDTRTRKIIQEVTMPILDNQLSLQNKIEFDIMKRLEDHHDRLEAVEYALYKTENPDSRFEKIYASLAEYEVNRRMDKQSFEDL